MANSFRNIMRFVQFVYKDAPCCIRAGVLKGDTVIDINRTYPTLPTTMLDILSNGDLEKVKCSGLQCVCERIPLSAVELAAPIHGMDKVLCIGLNYTDHCVQHGLTPPTSPMVFSKYSSTIIGPKDAVKIRTNVTEKVDWEVELVVVIGKKASNIKAADANNYIFGYTIGQDISARDWQKEKNGGQFLLERAHFQDGLSVIMLGSDDDILEKLKELFKFYRHTCSDFGFCSMDTFCPIGPCIITSDQIGDPQQLDIKCSVNGVLKQSSRTDQLVHKIPDIIERLTSVMTLLPGDIILTGTPGGVGMYRDPPEYLRPGDVIRSEIQNIGVLEIKCVEFTD